MDEIVYCTVADITAGEPQLADQDRLKLDLQYCCNTARQEVRQDLCAYADLVRLEHNGTVHPSIRRLAVLKAKELAYRQYYSSRIPDNSQVQQYRADYEGRLKMLIEDIRSGRIDSQLQPPAAMEPGQNTLRFF